MSMDEVHDLAIIKRFLLAMLGGKPVEAVCPLAGFGSRHWDGLCRMAIQHRLEPMLHEVTRSGPNQDAIPAIVKQGWADAYRGSAMQAMAARSTLSTVAGVLDRSDIAYAALKGAALAWHGYAHPALRPMRDFDILISPARALDAYRALIEAGFELDAHHTTPVALALEQNKHLPGLVDPKTGICVELHTRLLDFRSTANANCFLFDTGALLAGRMWRDLGAERIACLPATENLLHIVVHAVREHRFDNGPLVLNDIIALLTREGIAWPRFWTMAEEGGWVRDCAIVLALVEHYHGARNVDWGPVGRPSLPSGMLDDAALMMLQDTERRVDLAVQVELAQGTRRDKAMRSLKRLFPPRHAVAAFAGRADGLAVWVHYPAWLLSRLKRTAGGAFSKDQRAEAVRASRVEAWLRQG